MLHSGLAASVMATARGCALQVWVHPKSSKPSARHVKFQDRRPVLAARYEPSSRILALLLPAAGPEGASKHAVAFLAFTPDFRQLQLTHELPVELQGDCSTGPEGALVYTGELPFVLLPAVADTDGAGMANKVSPQDFAVRPTAVCVVPGVVAASLTVCVVPVGQSCDLVRSRLSSLLPIVALLIFWTPRLHEVSYSETQIVGVEIGGCWSTRTADSLAY